MKQTDIFDYMGQESDPIFNKINALKKGQTVDLGGVIISLNLQGLYELESTFHHECFSSKRLMYDGLSSYLSLLVL